MKIQHKILSFFNKKQRRRRLSALDLLKYIGPGLLVTVGFIDPGNWTSNLAAGADFSYSLLWIVTLSTLILIYLQHNAAHLGIASGLCLAEAATIHLKKPVSRVALFSAIGASVSTSLAEILGSAIALNMLFNIPLRIGALLTLAFVLIMLFTNSYRAIEKWIIGFVTIIGLSFIYEISLVNIQWDVAAKALVTPSLPEGSIMIIMSVLGAVVMPHNLFLHSEIIQSRQWNLQHEKIIRRQLNYEYVDTIFSMLVGWAINCCMILLAAATFFHKHIPVNELQQAGRLLEPLLGTHARVVFAVALLFSGIASTITSGFAAGSIFAGLKGESFDIKDNFSRLGISVSLIGATVFVFIIDNPYQALLLSQMLLSIQLPITIFLQIYLTSSDKVMGKYKNSVFTKTILYFIFIVVSALNILLFLSMFFNIHFG